MKLSLLWSECGFAVPVESAFADLPIQTITERSNEADGTSVFVCVRGARADGHSYAADAYRRGCRIFLAEEPLGLPADALVQIVPDSHPILGLLASALCGHPSRKMRVIGMTGTKGKTTTAHLLAHILNQSGIPCGYIGTTGISFGSRHKPTANTTPDAVTLQRTLREMADAGIMTAVVEVSSQALYLERVAGTVFDTAVFTNFYPDHIGAGEHPDLEHYFACKHRLFTDYGIRTAVINTDDPKAAAMVAGTSAGTVVSCGTDASCDYSVAGITPERSGASLFQRFTLRTAGGKCLAGVLPLIGRGNVLNALQAVAVADRAFGIPPERTVPLLASSSVPGRSEILPLSNGATAVIDYAHNGASLSQLLSSLRDYSPNRILCLFGSVGERTVMRRRELGTVAASFADLCVLTSDNPGTEDPQVILSDIAKAFAGKDTPYVSIPDRAEAIREAIRLCRAGDILVLAGKGHETYQLIGKEKIPFCEKDCLAEAEKSLLRI